jgi:hypothetical protein
VMQAFPQPGAEPISARLAACDKTPAAYRTASTPAPPWSPPGSPRSRTDAGLSDNGRPHRNPNPGAADPRPDQCPGPTSRRAHLCLAEADPADRAEVYRQLELKLTYYPELKSPRTGTACLTPGRTPATVGGAICGTPQSLAPAVGAIVEHAALIARSSLTRVPRR